jgi:hypothetical protein
MSALLYVPAFASLCKRQPPIVQLVATLLESMHACYVSLHLSFYKQGTVSMHACMFKFPLFYANMGQVDSATATYRYGVVPLHGMTTLHSIMNLAASADDIDYWAAATALVLCAHCLSSC